MNTDQISLATWITNYEAGQYNSTDVATCIKMGWYDWFCNDSQLHKRAKKFFAIIKSLKHSTKVDINKSYIFFKNNCPLVGPTYDSFSICSMDNGNVQYWIGFEKGNFEVVTAPNFDPPTLKTDEAAEVINFFQD